MSAMPPTPEDIDAARAQPHPDDGKAARKIVAEWSLGGPVPSHNLLVGLVASAISAARERGAIEERAWWLGAATIKEMDERCDLVTDFYYAHEDDFEGLNARAAAIRARGTT